MYPEEPVDHTYDSDDGMPELDTSRSDAEARKWLFVKRKFKPGRGNGTQADLSEDSECSDDDDLPIGSVKKGKYIQTEKKQEHKVEEKVKKQEVKKEEVKKNKDVAKPRAQPRKKGKVYAEKPAAEKPAEEAEKPAQKKLRKKQCEKPAAEKPAEEAEKPAAEKPAEKKVKRKRKLDEVPIEKPVEVDTSEKPIEVETKKMKKVRFQANPLGNSVPDAEKADKPISKLEKKPKEAKKASETAVSTRKSDRLRSDDLPNKLSMSQ
jgi:hypothetical protein